MLLWDVGQGSAAIAGQGAVWGAHGRVLLDVHKVLWGHAVRVLVRGAGQGCRSGVLVKGAVEDAGQGAVCLVCARWRGVLVL